MKTMRSKLHALVIGAGFGGLEVAKTLSDELGDKLDLTLIDQNDSFFFGYNKFDVIFGKKSAAEVKLNYRRIQLPGVHFVQEHIISVDPDKKRVVTNIKTHQGDILVIALGADYDFDETPGLLEGGNEFYSFLGAEKIKQALPKIKSGNIIIGACSAPFKCPPAPSEMALLTDQYLRKHNIRDRFHIQLVVPFEYPIPPSLRASKVLLKEFAQRGIEYVPEMMIYQLDPGTKVAMYDDGTEVPYELFLGIPAHCVPSVLKNSDLIFDEWVKIDKYTMQTSIQGVYAIGDVAHMGTPKAGFYAEKAGRTAALHILSEYRGEVFSAFFDGKSKCFIEYGDQQNRVARVDVDFFSSPYGKGRHFAPSREIAKEKEHYGISREKRWFV